MKRLEVKNLGFDTGGAKFLFVLEQVVDFLSLGSLTCKRL